MKRKLLGVIAYSLTIGLTTALVLGITACSSSLASTSTPALALLSIDVEPASPANLNVGSTQQFQATATYSNGSTADVTSKVTWTSDTPGTAVISSAGLATCVGVGSTNIRATMSGMTSPAVTLTVILLSAINIAPISPASLGVGFTQQFTATGTYPDGSTADVTSKVTWASSDNTIATINSTGLATGESAGNTNITASLFGVTSPAISLTVAAPTTSP